MFDVQDTARRMAMVSQFQTGIRFYGYQMFWLQSNYTYGKVGKAIREAVDDLMRKHGAGDKILDIVKERKDLKIRLPIKPLKVNKRLWGKSPEELIFPVKKEV